MAKISLYVHKELFSPLFILLKSAMLSFYLSKILFELVRLELECLFEIVVFWHDGDFGSVDFCHRPLKVEQLTLYDFNSVAVCEVVHILFLSSGNFDAHSLGGFLELFKLSQSWFHTLREDGAHHEVLVEVTFPKRMNITGTSIFSSFSYFSSLK